jgi:hypothetical protein
MLNMDEINQEIEKLEKCDYTTYDICKKLAILYVVKDHYGGKADSMMPMSKSVAPSMSAPPIK